MKFRPAAVKPAYVALMLLLAGLTCLTGAPVSAASLFGYYEYDYGLEISQNSVYAGQEFTVIGTAHLTCVAKPPFTVQGASATGSVVASNNRVSVTILSSYTVGIDAPNTPGQTVTEQVEIVTAFPAGTPPGSYAITGNLASVVVYVAGGSMDVTDLFPRSQGLGSMTILAAPLPPPYIPPTEEVPLPTETEPPPRTSFPLPTTFVPPTLSPIMPEPTVGPPSVTPAPPTTLPAIEPTVAPTPAPSPTEPLPPATTTVQIAPTSATISTWPFAPQPALSTAVSAVMSTSFEQTAPSTTVTPRGVEVWAYVIWPALTAGLILTIVALLFSRRKPRP